MGAIVIFIFLWKNRWKWWI